MKNFVLPTVALGLILSTSPARAETGASAALFSAGREAFKRGDFAAARDQFAESERLEPAAGTELNLALCEERLGHLLRAWQLFQMLADKLPPNDERSPIARQHFVGLGARLPRLTLRVEAALPPGTELRFGATHLTPSSLGVPIPLDPGVTELAVVAPGRARRVYLLRLDEGDDETLLVAAGAVDDPRRANGVPPAAPVHRRDSHRTLGILGVGLGVSLAAVGAAAGIGALQAKSVVRNECDADLACSDEGLAAARRGSLLTVVSTTA
ncbi:MAG TPA: hypothetical protein VEQ59_19315, partial [Polyangiaceae bacterium]|nr:hypothetical protein [Polyangiaceae bacterium]